MYYIGLVGKIIAHVHVIKSQKRGLPHVPMPIIFDENDKLNSLEDCFHVVKAEIPNEEEEHELYNAVIRHMIRSPCGRLNLSSSSMKHCSCKTTTKERKKER